jgi:hypothetical protein
LAGTPFFSQPESKAGDRVRVLSREQPHRVLGEKLWSRLTPPRPAGRPVRGHPLRFRFGKNSTDANAFQLLFAVSPFEET